MATTTRVSCGRPSRSRLLRIPAAASATLLAFSRLSETGPYYRERLWPSNAGYPGGPTRQFLPDQRNPCRCLDPGEIPNTLKIHVNFRQRYWPSGCTEQSSPNLRQKTSSEVPRAERRV